MFTQQCGKFKGGIWTKWAAYPSRAQEIQQCGLRVSCLPGDHRPQPSPRETKSPVSLGQVPCPQIQLWPWPNKKPIIGQVLYPQSSRHFDYSQGKNKERFIFQNAKILGGVAETKGISDHNVQMPFEPATIIFRWFPVPGSLLPRLFWLSPVWGARFLVHSPPYFMINLIQFPM